MEHNCKEGWVCEAHPEQPWPHPVFVVASRRLPGHIKDCLGPGMPCQYPNCEMSLSQPESKERIS